MVCFPLHSEPALNQPINLLEAQFSTTANHLWNFVHVQQNEVRCFQSELHDVNISQDKVIMLNNWSLRNVWIFPFVSCNLLKQKWVKFCRCNITFKNSTIFSWYMLSVQTLCSKIIVAKIKLRLNTKCSYLYRARCNSCENPCFGKWAEICFQCL